MKNITLAAAIAAIATLSAPAALAETTFYGNLGYTAFDGDGATLGGATLRGGAQFTPNFGAEIEASVGTNSDDDQGIEFDLASQYAAYAVGYLPLGDSFNLLGRIGYGSGTIDVTFPGFGSGSADVDGFLFGFGGEYMFNNNFGVRGDITRFEANDDNLDGGLDLYSIAAVYKFGGAK